MALGSNLYNMVLIKLVAIGDRGCFYSFMYFILIGLYSGTYRDLKAWCKKRVIDYIYLCPSLFEHLNK